MSEVGRCFESLCSVLTHLLISSFIVFLTMGPLKPWAVTMCLDAQLVPDVAFGSSRVPVCPSLFPGSLLAVRLYSRSLSVYSVACAFLPFCPYLGLLGWLVSFSVCLLPPPPPSISSCLFGSLPLSQPLCFGGSQTVSSVLLDRGPGFTKCTGHSSSPQVVPSGHGSEPRGTGTRCVRGA